MVNLNQPTRCYKPYNSHLHTHHCENLKSHLISNLYTRNDSAHHTSEDNSMERLKLPKGTMCRLWIPKDCSQSDSLSIAVIHSTIYLISITGFLDFVQCLVSWIKHVLGTFNFRWKGGGYLGQVETATLSKWTTIVRQLKLCKTMISFC
jgi:hypothetical protein